MVKKSESCVYLGWIFIEWLVEEISFLRTNIKPVRMLLASSQNETTRNNVNKVILKENKLDFQAERRLTQLEVDWTNDVKISWPGLNWIVQFVYS